MRRHAALAATLIGFAFFTVVYYLNAWVVDDAYITYRSIDNFFNGYGLTWNVDERVQAFTHPLWLFLNLAVVFITNEYFFTGIALSYLVSIASLLIVWSRLEGDGTPWKFPLFLLGVMACKAVFDYTSSGLENPLSYLLCAVFFGRLLPRPNLGDFDRKEISFYFFMAALAFVNRQDMLLLLLPALCYLLLQAFRSQGRSALLTVIVATSPAWLWLLFSLFYYGFPFPNTYYAKSANASIPLNEQLRLGWAYFTYSMSADIPGAVCLVLSSAVVVFKRRLLPGLALGGVALYVVYTICMAATATHMAHRFFAVPIFVALLLLVQLISDERVAWVLAAALLAALIFVPNSPLRIGTDSYVMKTSPPARIDTKWFLHANGGSLRGNLPPGPVVPRHGWYQDGLRFRESAERIRFGGPVRLGHPGMGFFGFAAGPSKYIVDPVALCDPLLARLPGRKWWTKWKPGHYRRALPTGYIESIATGENLIHDPMLALYYDKIRLITRGPLFDGSRLVAIVEMNLGLHDDLRDNYLKRLEEKSARIGNGASP